MMTFYAAAGSYQIRSEDGKNMPYIMRLGKLQPVSIPEFSLWSMLLWDVLTYEELRKKFYDKMEETEIEPSSFDKSLEMIENHIIPVLGHIQLSKLSSIQIQRFYNDLHTQGRLDNHGNRKYEPLSASTVKHIHAVLSGALKQAVKERIIPFNPCDNCKIPKREKKEQQ